MPRKSNSAATVASQSSRGTASRITRYPFFSQKAWSSAVSTGSAAITTTMTTILHPPPPARV